MIGVCIPAHRPRLEELLGCLETMAHQQIQFLIVTNEPNPILPEDLPDGVALYNTGSEEINLSKWWNIGRDWAVDNGHESFMVTESDVRLTPDNVYLLHTALWSRDFSMVGPNLYGTMKPDEVSVETTITGWGRRHAGHRICQTWMVKTFSSMPADERFTWWHADEQHEMRHRVLDNGTAMIGAATYERPLFQTTNPRRGDKLWEDNRRSREIFLEEWGFPTMIGC